MTGVKQMVDNQGRLWRLEFNQFHGKVHVIKSPGYLETKEVRMARFAQSHGCKAMVTPKGVRVTSETVFTEAATDGAGLAEETELFTNMADLKDWLGY